MAVPTRYGEKSIEEEMKPWNAPMFKDRRLFVQPLQAKSGKSSRRAILRCPDLPRLEMPKSEVIRLTANIAPDEYEILNQMAQQKGVPVTAILRQMISDVGTLREELWQEDEKRDLILQSRKDKKDKTKALLATFQ